MPPKPKSLTGKMILDSGELAGSFFARTAVLICRHDVEGAFGLVLNRSTGTTVGDVLVADLPEAMRTAPLFMGGPVQPSALSFLHVADLVPSEEELMSRVTLGHSLDELLELAELASQTHKFKVFAGYAGWSPGQLESELKRNAWITHPASLDLIFDTPTCELWPLILRRKGGWRNRLLAEIPEDPSLN